MRILQVVSRFDFGGAENHVRELSNQLQQCNHQVFIISQRGRQTQLLERGITFIRSRFWCKLILLRALFYIYQIRKYQIEVIHAHQRLPIVAASIAGLITGSPVVATVHGRARYDLRSRLSRKIPKNYIFVSQQVLEVSRHKQQIENRSVLIPNGVHLTQSDKNLNPFHLGYISRMDKRHLRMVQLLIAIMPRLKERFPSIQLSIIGEGNKMQQIRQQAEQINLHAGRCIIQIHGYLDNVNQQEKDMGLIIGVGRVAIGAAMSGCAVISANS